MADGWDSFTQSLQWLSGQHQANQALGAVGKWGASDFGGGGSADQSGQTQTDTGKSGITPLQVQSTADQLSRGKQYLPAYKAASQQYGVPVQLMLAQGQHESDGWAPDVVSGKRKSSAGAVGISQFMPDTAKVMGFNPADPNASIYNQAKYMRQLFEMTPTNLPSAQRWSIALSKYSTGPNYNHYNSDYVNKVLGYTGGWAKLLGQGSENAMTAAGYGGSPDTGTKAVATGQPGATAFSRSGVNPSPTMKATEQPQQTGKPDFAEASGSMGEADKGAVQQVLLNNLATALKSGDEQAIQTARKQLDQYAVVQHQAGIDKLREIGPESVGRDRQYSDTLMNRKPVSLDAVGNVAKDQSRVPSIVASEYKPPNIDPSKQVGSEATLGDKWATEASIANPIERQTQVAAKQPVEKSAEKPVATSQPGSQPASAAPSAEPIKPPTNLAGYSVHELAQEIKKANPGVSPRVLGQALLYLAPLMNQQAQNQIRSQSAMDREYGYELGYRAREDSIAAQNQRAEMANQTKLEVLSTTTALKTTAMDQQYREYLGRQDIATKRLAISQNRAAQEAETAAKRLAQADTRENRQALSQKLQEWDRLNNELNRVIKDKASMTGGLNALPPDSPILKQEDDRFNQVQAQINAFAKANNFDPSVGPSGSDEGVTITPMQ